MTYSNHGLYITLDDLKKIVECVEKQSKYNCMEQSIFITNEPEPKIIQYCCYPECNSIEYTIGVKHLQR